MKNVLTIMLLLTLSCSQICASPYPIKAVIFDCDGTLVDTEVVLCEAWIFAFHQQGYTMTEEEYWELLHQQGIASLPIACLVMAELGCKILNRECKEELLEDIRTDVQVKKEKGFPAISATIQFLRQLGEMKKELGIKIGLASGNYKKNILFHLKELEIEHYFDVIVSGQEDLSNYHDAEGTNKPKPYVYQHAAKLLGVLPSECVAIEDSGVGVTAAVTAGCITIAVPNRASTVCHDLSQAHLKIDSFSEIDVPQFLELIENNLQSGRSETIAKVKLGV